MYYGWLNSGYINMWRKEWYVPPVDMVMDIMAAVMSRLA
jgi:hypothetical protein